MGNIDNYNNAKAYVPRDVGAWADRVGDLLAKNGALEAEIVRLEAEVVRLNKIICNFCDNYRYAADIYKKQECIAPLFDVAKKEVTKSNEAKPPKEKS